MPHVIRIDRTGGPEVMEWVEVPRPAPGRGQVLLRQTAIGLNFIDTYLRAGVYKMDLPIVLGQEAAGVVEEVGPDVTSVSVGERVVYQGINGAYADVRLVPAERVVRIPHGIDDRTAAAIFLKGVTAFYLLRRTFKVEPGQTILFHAAAGGVGQIATQWAKSLGAVVIGTVGSDEKAEIARANGCAHVINYAREDFVTRTREITGGAGVEVVYDSVGKDTFPGSLDCLKPLGMWVSFGQSSGLPPPFTAAMLQQRGSLFATRPTTGHYFAHRHELEAAATELFDHVAKGVIKVAPPRVFSLRQAAEAHRALEARETTGSTVLIP
jgi:NADPH2:quinone reductase